VEISKGKGKGKSVETVNLEEFIEVRGWKALGNKLSSARVVDVRRIAEPEAPDDDEAIAEEAAPVKKAAGKKATPAKTAVTKAAKKAVEKKEQSPAEQAGLFGEPPQK